MFSKRSNLPPTSSPWGKEVEDKIAALERENTLLRGTVTAMAAVVRALPVPVAGPVQTFGRITLEDPARGSSSTYATVNTTGTPTVQGSLDPQTGGFLVTESGIYVVSANMTYQTTSGTGNRALRIMKGGATQWTEIQPPPTGSWTLLNAGGVISAEVGDLISVEAWQNSGASVFLSGTLTISKHQ